MKIYFCDLCNESVPVGELRDGKASTVKGKIVCARCLPPAAESAVAAPRGAGGALAWIATALALVGVGAAGSAFLYARSIDGRVSELPDPSAQLASLDQRAASLEGQKADTQAVADLDRARKALSSDLSRLEGELVDQNRRLDTAEKGLQELRGLLDVLRVDRDRTQKVELQLETVQASIEELRRSVSEIGQRLENAVHVAQAGPGDAGGNAKKPLEERLSQFDPETRAIVAELSSSEPNVRWSAVDRLASRNDPDLVPVLLPLLDDPDAFVQYRVIDCMRNLKARVAVPRLIALLRDVDPIVREEALEALISLTGRTQRFDVSNREPDEREPFVREWERWYEENRDRFQAQSS